MSETKNIIIIGASMAGQGLANALVPNLPLTHRILLIDALGFASWPIGSLRAAVVPGWENKVVAPLSTATVFPAGSAHQVIAPNKVVELKANSIILEKPFEGKTEIPFFKCILATGSSQPSPMRPAPGSSLSEYKASLTKSQNDLAEATKVVVIGAGTVGIEISGEIRAAHPKTSITLIHSGKHVLNPTAKPIEKTNSSVQPWSSPASPLKLSTNVESQLKSLNINTILGDKAVIPSGSGVAPGEWDGKFGLQEGVKGIKLESGKTVEADYVFLSIGNKVNSSLVGSVDNGALDSGLIAVDEYLQVRSSSPSSILTANYLAIGDCASTPGWKTAVNAQADADLAAVNIVSLVKGQSLKKLARGSMIAMAIPLGPNHGTGAMVLPVVGTMSMPTFMVKAVKGKNLFHDNLFLGRFKGAEKVSVA